MKEFNAYPQKRLLQITAKNILPAELLGEAPVSVTLSSSLQEHGIYSYIWPFANWPRFVCVSNHISVLMKGHVFNYPVICTLCQPKSLPVEVIAVPSSPSPPGLAAPFRAMRDLGAQFPRR